MMQEYSSQHEEEIILVTKEIIISISGHNDKNEKPSNELIIKIVNLLEKIFLADDDIKEFGQFLVENTIKNMEVFQLKNEFFYELTNFDCLEEFIDKIYEKGTPDKTIEYFDEKRKNFEKNIDKIIPIRNRIFELR